jgi:hypothetical protein
VTPKARAISSHRSPNLPARSTIATSPADKVFASAASMAPVPDEANGITSCAV